ncbi:ATP-binding cassette sub-family G member 1 [Eumeta japonica]|uniref:ATP-binding cassette sub-family G member 1 n=1 Tax=Eumeta variegata TaxID=151549 RepID=A0A4C1YIB8_EUMVA|nr:ATP-binding cassette sub-family G member 1 [Eumeta japonica]
MPPVRRRLGNPCAVRAGVQAAGDGNKMNNSVNKRGMKVNVGKTKVMVFDRGESTTKCNILREALELVNNPPVFFLDEPTSGLDTVTAAQCVVLLKQLARQGRTVVVTVHQPAASLLEIFDQVYVIAEGRCIYQGDTSAMVPFLDSVGFPCPLQYNPADFIIELTENNENVQIMCEKMLNGKLYKSAKIEVPAVRSDNIMELKVCYQIEDDAPETQNGCAIGPMSIAPFLGLAIYGFDFAHSIPLLMNVIMKTSFIRCGVVAMVLTMFGLGRKPLDCDDVYCHFAKPDVLLKYLDIDRSSVWLEIVTMLSIMLVFRSLCYIGLRWRFAT